MRGELPISFILRELLPISEVRGRVADGAGFRESRRRIIIRVILPFDRGLSNRCRLDMRIHTHA